MLASKWKINLKVKQGLVAVFLYGFLNVANAQSENFKIGGFVFDLAATFNVTYNDNINYAEYNPIWDIILRPGIVLSGRYQVTELNTLSVSIGMGYEKYIRNPELDSINNFLNITPDTKIAFTVFIDDVTLEFYDRLSYSVDAADAFSLNGAVVSNNPLDYGRFTNIAGVDADWDLNDLVLFAGFSRLDVIPTSSLFDYTQRHEYQLAGGPRLMVEDNLTVGVTGSLNYNVYEEGVNNNSWSWSVGPMAIWQASENLSLAGNFAYQEFYFDTGGTINDSTQPSGIIGSVTASHRLSSVFEHSLTASHSFNYGYLSNVDSVFSVIYAFNWRMNSKISPRGQAFYELGADSGGSGFNSLGQPVSTAEDYGRYGVGVGVDYSLSSKLKASLDYAFSRKDSNLFNRSYTQNIVTLGLRYDF
ncbi:hypothetical protein [Cerasicoccus frondis]|uniref:hypothetical protein n=1 Tax=Cerasicoccus frondis TaxID=490090 RepID=UPI002852C0C9|nr:hypothetical protein [Cerasicoccus frondis]